MSRLTVFIFALFLSLATVLGDIFIKKAALMQKFSGWYYLLISALIYAATAFGWFFVVRRMKLSTAAVIYSISIVVLLALVSVFYFKEKLNITEIVGIIMAVLSLGLLYRFI